MHPAQAVAAFGGDVVGILHCLLAALLNWAWASAVQCLSLVQVLGRPLWDSQTFLTPKAADPGTGEPCGEVPETEPAVGARDAAAH